jgi:hypothetical protein
MVEYKFEDLEPQNYIICIKKINYCIIWDQLEFG